MAIDTAAKRASASSDGMPFSTLVIPDGTIDQGDRQTIGDRYGGILAGNVIVFTLSTTLFAMVASTLSFIVSPWNNISKGTAENYSTISKGDSESYSEISKGTSESWSDIDKGDDP